MAQDNRRERKLFIWLCCVSLCLECVTGDSTNSSQNPGKHHTPKFNTGRHVPGLKKDSAKPLTTDALGSEEGQGSVQSSSVSNSSGSQSSRLWSKSSGDGVASKRNASSEGGGAGAMAQRRNVSTSVVGSLMLLLITVVVTVSLFVMVVCFLHKWRENMGPTRYPRVEYSMLRQSEDEPEDVLGEILINIGLAVPEDIQPLTPSSSETDSSSPVPSEQEVDMCGLDDEKFTTIPLKADEAANRLLAPEAEESDEELLQ